MEAHEAVCFGRVYVGGQGSCRAGAEVRGSWTSSQSSCLALGPWPLLSPPPAPLWPTCAWSTRPSPSPGHSHPCPHPPHPAEQSWVCAEWRPLTLPRLPLPACDCFCARPILLPPLHLPPPTFPPPRPPPTSNLPPPWHLHAPRPLKWLRRSWESLLSWTPVTWSP